MKDDGYGRKGLIFDPFIDQGISGGLYRPKGAGSGFLSNSILKIVSRRDPIVATILHTRATQVSTFCKIPKNRFDTGFRIMPKNKSEKEDEEEVAKIEEFILNCGKKEERSKEDVLAFDQYGYMTTMDWLTYGHKATELVREMGGDLHCFLPLPAETIYRANKKIPDKEQVKAAIDSQRNIRTRLTGESDFDTESLAVADYDYLQVINGQVVEGFTDEDLLLTPIYMQSDIDLMGYAISPLERAISMITSHLQIENHQKMFFTHGVASRGILVIQGDVSPNQLRTLQAQWTNQITGPNGAWRTPILAGIDGVQWQPLVMTNRDMEYAAYQDHVLRTIHACFAIDPEETGFGYLSKGTEQKSMGESSNEWKVTASRDKGLKPILTRMAAMINEQILPAMSKEYAAKYDFVFVGIDAESREEEIQRLQEEVQLHSSVDEIRQEADKEPLAVGGGLILNPTWLQYVQTNMPKGMFMEKFMGIAGASERPDLQYIPDPLWFQWQQLQMQVMQAQAGQDPNNPDGDPNDPNGGDEGEEEGGPPQKDGGGNSPKKDNENPFQGDNSPKKDDSGEEPKDGEDASKEDEEAFAQQQAQQRNGIQQFIDANPDLFKSMNQNLTKKRKARIFNDKHVDVMRDSLVKDFEKASDILVREVMKAVSDDFKSRGDAEPHDEKGIDIPVPPLKKKKSKKKD
jgi:hypothetical protein